MDENFDKFIEETKKAIENQTKDVADRLVDKVGEFAYAQYSPFYNEINKLGKLIEKNKADLLRASIEKERALKNISEKLSKRGVDVKYLEELNKRIEAGSSKKDLMKFVKDNINVGNKRIISKEDVNFLIKSSRNVETLKDNFGILNDRAKEFSYELRLSEGSLKRASELTGRLAEGFKATGREVLKIHKYWQDVQENTFRMSRAMGMNRSQAETMNAIQLKNTMALAHAFGRNQEELMKFQKSYTENTGRNILLTTEQTKAMAAMGNLVGDETATQFAESMQKVGVSVGDSAALMADAQTKANHLGLNAAKMTSIVAKNINLLNRIHFRSGIDGLTRMVLKSQELGANVESIVNSAEKFATIQEAIQNSANIQMLGGRMGSEFMNPMSVMYESMADPEKFQERIARSVRGLATIDRETGEARVGVIDTMRIREQAKNLGMSMEELMNITKREAQNQAVQQQIRGNFSDVQISQIKNLAHFDRETGQYVVTTLNKAGEAYEEKAVSELTAEDLKSIKDNTVDEKTAFSDIRALRLKIVEGTAIERAIETTSQKENLKGIAETYRSSAANIINTPEKYASRQLTGNGAIGSALTGMLTAGGGLGAIAYMVLAPFIGVYMKQLLGKIGTSIRGRIGRVFTGGNGPTRTPNAVKPATLKGKTVGGTYRPINPQSTIAGGETVRDRLLRQRTDKQFINAVERNQRRIRLGGRLGGVLALSSIVAGATSNPEYSALDAAETVGSYGMMAGRRTLKKAGAKIALKTGLAKSATSALSIGSKIARAGNIAGWAGLLLDGVRYAGNATGTIKAGSGTDKALGIASSTAQYAGFGAIIGSMIAPGIGTAIGGAIGGAVGLFRGAVKEYGDKLGDVARSLGLIGEKISDEQKAQNYSISESLKSLTDYGGITDKETLEVEAYKAVLRISNIMQIRYNVDQGLTAEGKSTTWIQRQLDKIKSKYLGYDTSLRLSVAEPPHAASGAIVPGDSYAGDRRLMKVNSGEMILNKPEQSKLFNVLNGTSAIEGSDLGSSSFSHVSEGSSSSYGASEISSTISLNVSGTIKLDLGGRQADIDANKLLDSPEFRSQLTDMIARKLNESSNGAKFNKESHKINQSRQYNTI